MSDQNPTVVLVHGAFADSSSWNGVVQRLTAQGYPVIAAANPLRGVDGDSQYVSELVDSLAGDVVLVGHSYGGMLISNAARGKGNVRALVFVAAFAPDEGESAGDLASKFPGSTLGETLETRMAAGAQDLYIEQGRYPQQFAADVAPDVAALMAVTQRPIASEALGSASGAPSWADVPSWFIFGDQDKNIPAAALRFMAERASSRNTVEISGGSHAIGVSYPDEVAAIIVEAASATSQ
ncbi:alpha/beta fold hydrolase [Micromonospora chokoriensis]